MRISSRVISLACILLAIGVLLGKVAYDKLRIADVKAPPAQAQAKSSARPQDAPLLWDVEFLAVDNRALEDSRSLELIGKTGTGVNAVEVWSSCDDDAHRLKSFLVGKSGFTYKASPSLGNVCRGHNDYVVKVFGIRDGKEQELADRKITLVSNVGIRSQPELTVLRFLDSHTLPPARSIEAQSQISKRFFPSPEFRTACVEFQSYANDAPFDVNAGMGARIDAVAKVSGSGAAKAFPNAAITWFDRSNGSEYPSARILSYILGACDRFLGAELWAPSSSRAFIRQDGSPRIAYFDGRQWVDAREHLLRIVPVASEDLSSLRLAVTDTEFSLSETTETRSTSHSVQFPDQRGEYLFSLQDGAFLGVIWHRKR